MTTTRELALVTGGSAGIGYALAHQCARNGFDLIITGAGSRVHESARSLASATGAQVTPVQSDLRTAEGVDQVWKTVTDTGRPLTIAMLNAGVAIGGAFVDTDLAEEVAAIELNVISQVRLAKPIVQDGTGVTVTALLPGATATEFHQRAGMGNTRFGDNSWKNDPEVVARKGFTALLAGRDHVIGGDRAAWRAAVINKFLPETTKAARQAKQARPQ